MPGRPFLVIAAGVFLIVIVVVRIFIEIVVHLEARRFFLTSLQVGDGLHQLGLVVSMAQLLDLVSTYPGVLSGFGLMGFGLVSAGTGVGLNIGYN